MEPISPPPPLKHLVDETTRSLLISLRVAVAPTLSNNLLPHFTNHSISHSDNLTELIDDLIEPLQTSSNRLTDKELIILYSACYLHDIGLQYERAGNSQPIIELDLAQSWEELSEDTRRRLLREHHHEISADMVMKSATVESIIGMRLTPDYEPASIADVCEAHCVNAPSDKYDKLTKNIAGIRLALISGLLRISDILDESRGRALRSKADTLDLDLEAQTHWWRHHYTKDVTIDQHEKTITVWFEFPEAHLSEYSKIIPELQMPEIEAEFVRQMTVFHRYGLGWSVTSEIISRRRSDAVPMPHEVTGAMLRKLASKRRQEEEQKRHVVAQQLVEVRPHIDRRLKEAEAQKVTLAPGEYFRLMYEIATDLWELGGKRSAWMLLWNEYNKVASTLDTNDRLKYGVKVSRMMVDDGSEDTAMNLLHGILPLADQLPDQDELKTAFYELWAKCLVTTLNHEEATKALEKLIQISKSDSAKEEYKAQLAEMFLLLGDLTQALEYCS